MFLTGSQMTWDCPGIYSDSPSLHPQHFSVSAQDAPPLASQSQDSSTVSVPSSEPEQVPCWTNASAVAINTRRERGTPTTF